MKNFDMSDFNKAKCSSTTSKTLTKVSISDRKRNNRPLNPYYLLHTFSELVTSHNYNDFYQLFQVLCTDRKIPQEILKRGVLLIVATQLNNPLTFNKTKEGLKQIFLDLFKLGGGKVEVVLEYAMLLIRLQKHEEDMSLSFRSLTRCRLFQNPMHLLSACLLKGYVSLFSYIKWIKMVYDYNSHYLRNDIEILNLAEEVIEKLIAAINFSPYPMDNFFLKIIEVSIYNRNLNEAKNHLVWYAKKFPDHVNSYIFLYEIMANFLSTDGDLESIAKECFENISALDPSSKYIYKICKLVKISNSKKCESLMNYLDFLDNKYDVEAWFQLLTTIIEIDLTGELSVLCDIFKKKYCDYWSQYHYNFYDFEKPLAYDLILYKTLLAFYLEEFINYQKYAKKFLKMDKTNYVNGLVFSIKLMYGSVRLPKYLCI